jgi:uncharacterized protein DUF5681
MADQPRRPKPASDDRPGSSDKQQPYQVGFRHPPKHRQFRPGQSGNPKGRPKRRPNLRTVIDEILSQPIKVREGNRTRSVNKFAGVVLAIVNRALQGDAKAQASFIALLRASGMIAQTPEPASAEPVTDHDAEIIVSFLRSFGLISEETIASDGLL